MKRAGLWAFGLGMLCIVGILTVKPGYPVLNKCSVATLKGTYLSSGITYNVFPPGTPTVVVHIAVAARAIYHGDGTTNILARLTVNGVVQPDSVSTGTYTVDEDCKGTETTIDPVTGAEHQMLTIISPDGDELHTVGIDPGVVRAFVVRKVEK